MKKALIVVLVAAFGALAGCSHDTPQGGEGESSPSPSSPEPAPGVESHTFEGVGEDDYVDTERIELYGQYDVEWEVVGNGVNGSQHPGNFDIRLEGSDVVTIASSNVADGSGTERIEVDAGSYYASVFFWPDAEWKITLTRTCNGLPPDCPELEE